MEKLKKKRVIWLSLAIFSSVSVIPLGIFLAMAALDGNYLAVGVILPLLAHGCYGIPLYFFAFAKARVDISVFREIEIGEAKTVAAIAEKLSLTDAATRLFVSRIISSGYAKISLGAGGEIIYENK